ncbi:cytochrome c biogenesis protein CcdA [Pullulanibacillus sp. KACC 23026]|uniref:cytochrome c biogenesis protein CcdA n=1 Tax=Pullulanibacillus sp. KACC 23026 TaxID=3028315 RepID=UPI0023AF54CB|nr:cytochrome c biogenesis protein CcdA [Pullulanibacillus sp. KACC 23026]WEG12578.1 cytochrome c biogenesis protein CcdA [Pullulanibacillus sp. KACC 23026]
MAAHVTLLLAFGAGLLSFISPCTFPVYPGFLSYVTGVSVEELRDQKGMRQRRALLHALLFLLGFSIIFVALGASTSFIGQLFSLYGDFLRRIGGILIVVFGLVVVGVFKPEFLMQEKKITFKNRPAGYFGSILIGMGFAAGWTPCSGPILVSVMAMGIANPGLGLFYMAAYVLGFAVPFVVLAFFIGRLKWIRTYSSVLTKAGGIIMIVMGVLLFFDWMPKLSSYIVSLFGGFTGF